MCSWKAAEFVEKCWFSKIAFKLSKHFDNLNFNSHGLGSWAADARVDIYYMPICIISYINSHIFILHDHLLYIIYHITQSCLVTLIYFSSIPQKTQTYEKVSDQGPVWVRSKDKIPGGLISTQGINIWSPECSLVA